MLLVEHDMHLVMDLADRVLAMDFGRVLAVGTPAEVRRDAAVVEAYLGAAPS
jgi:branched-chain amino acid transport system ATP-binding protein